MPQGKEGGQRRTRSAAAVAGVEAAAFGFAGAGDGTAAGAGDGTGTPAFFGTADAAFTVVAGAGGAAAARPAGCPPPAWPDAATLAAQACWVGNSSDGRGGWASWKTHGDGDATTVVGGAPAAEARRSSPRSPAVAAVDGPRYSKATDAARPAAEGTYDSNEAVGGLYNTRYLCPRRTRMRRGQGSLRDGLIQGVTGRRVDNE
jgi:hypothetical protein